MEEYDRHAARSEKLDVKALKEAQEAEFQAWAEQNTLPEEGFVDALGMIREAVNDNMAYTGPAPSI